MTYADAVLADSPDYYWRLDDAGPTNASDSSGNGKTATASGTAAFQATGTGKDGMPSDLAVTFPGTGTTTAKISRTGETAFAPSSTGLTIEAWVKQTTPTTWTHQPVVAINLNDTTRFGFIARHNASTNAMSFWSSSGGWDESSPAQVLTVDTWYHLAWVISGTNLDFYVNGSFINSAAISTQPTTCTAITIGQRSETSTGEHFSGVISEVAIWRSALTSTQIGDHYTAATTSGGTPYTETKTEALGLTDSAALALGYGRLAADALGLTDTVTVNKVITFTPLAGAASSVGATSYSTADFSITADTLIVVMVLDSVGSGQVETPTVAWVGTGAVSEFSSDAQNTSVATSRRVSSRVYRCTSSGTGHFTFTMGVTHNACLWSVFQVAGASLSAPVVQKTTKDTTALSGSPLTGSIALPSGVTSGNAIVSLIATNVNQNATCPNGTEIHDFYNTDTSPTESVVTQYETAPADATSEAQYGTSGNYWALIYEFARDTGTGAWSETPADTEALTDAVSRAWAAARTAADAMGLSDTGVRVNHALVGTEIVGVTDSVTVVPGTVSGESYTETPSDALALSDTAVTEAGRTQTVTDSLPTADSVTLTRDTVQTSTDSLGLTDTVTVAVTWPREVTDQAGTTDSVTVQRAVARTVADTMATTDTHAALVQRAVEVDDSIGITDTATTARAVTVADATTLADTAATVTVRSRDVSDTQGLTDSVTITRTVAVTAADTEGLTDLATTQKTGAGIQEATDLMGVSDTVALTREVARTTTDTEGLTDTGYRVDHTLTGTAQVGLTDRVTVTVEAGAQDYTETPDDTLGLADSVQVAVTVAVTTSDSVGLTDLVSRARDVAVAVADVEGLADSATVEGAGSVAVSDLMGLSDTVARTRTVQAPPVTDPVGLTDTVTVTVTRSRAASEVMDLSDSVTLTRTVARTVTDTEALTDTSTQAKSGAGAVSQDDVMGVSDSVTLTRTVARVVDDTVTLTDTSDEATGTGHTVTVDDTLGTLDLTRFGVYLTVVDTLPPLETVALDRALTTSDDLDLTDDATTDARVGGAFVGWGVPV